MKRRSEAWLHFTETSYGRGKVKAKCNKCKALLACHQGTSSMWKHAELCLGVVRPSKRPRQRSPPCPPLSRSGGGSSEPGSGSSSEREPGLEEDEEASQDLARMIALRGYDPSIVEDDHFRSFVHRLNPGFKLPSRRHVETMCDGILGVQERLDKQFERVQEELRMVYENRSKSSSAKVQEMGPDSRATAAATGPASALSPSGFPDLHESNQEEASKRLSGMIAFGGHDPLLVEDECFRSFVASLSQGFRVLSCLEIQMVRDGILDMLRRSPGKMSSNRSAHTPNKRSKVWKYFRQELVDGVVKAVCTYCGSMLTIRRKSGTKSLHNHIAEHCPKISVEDRNRFLQQRRSP